MQYGKTVTGRFLSRPNRFIAHVEIDGTDTVCHVKNTGRCKELLTPGAKVVLEVCENPARKTAFDLIAVYKGDLLINMDSQSPNKAFGEWAATSGFFGAHPKVTAERTYGASRFDFFIEKEDGEKIFVEVKGVTLEQDGIYRFPDAPTGRGAKHMKELASALREGYTAMVFFVAQAENCRCFLPNEKTDPAFAAALRESARQGVQVYCVNCLVTEDTMNIFEFIPAILEGGSQL
ncbi:MAG: DNA/RNA nuclease SfsA [Ruminococcaceae bacterium]|nr:DNA/RNA nuclease SfsA [Oscillospiraceae bacterium]